VRFYAIFMTSHLFIKLGMMLIDYALQVIYVFARVRKVTTGHFEKRVYENFMIWIDKSRRLDIRTQILLFFSLLHRKNYCYFYYYT
jgi:hypothetical protein